MNKKDRYKENCVICTGEGKSYTSLVQEGSDKSYEYFKCKNCGSIFIEPIAIEMMDSGKNWVRYREDYWSSELKAAKERCFGSGLARMAEAIYYARIPIKNFLDIGTGTGYFLDAVQAYLPSKVQYFWGGEKYPPKMGGGADKIKELFHL